MAFRDNILQGGRGLRRGADAFSSQLESFEERGGRGQVYDPLTIGTWDLVIDITKTQGIIPINAKLHVGLINTLPFDTEIAAAITEPILAAASTTLRVALYIEDEGSRVKFRRIPQSYATFDCATTGIKKVTFSEGFVIPGRKLLALAWIQVGSGAATFRGVTTNGGSMLRLKEETSQPGLPVSFDYTRYSDGVVNPIMPDVRYMTPRGSELF